MTTRIGALLKRYNEEATPFSTEDVVSAWNARLSDLGLDVTVEDAVVDPDGQVKLNITSPNGDFVEVGFFVRDEDGEAVPYAVTMGDENGEGALEMNLANMNVPVVDGGTGMFVDMVNLDWVTDEFASALLSAEAAIDAEPEIEPDEVPVGSDEEPMDMEPEEGDEYDDGEMEPEDDDEEPIEGFVAIYKKDGKLKAEKVGADTRHRIRCRRARASFRASFEKMESCGNRKQRRSSIKPRRR